MDYNERQKKRDEKILQSIAAMSTSLYAKVDKLEGKLATSNISEYGAGIAIHAGIISAFADIAVELAKAINNVNAE